MTDWLNKTHVGDCRELLRAMAADGVRAQTCVTSPPYFGLRDYGHAGQIGLEPTAEVYIQELCAVFRAVRDVLSDDGTLWLNLGDSYGPSKQLQGIPWRVAFALQEDGWTLRSDIIWHKPNPMPESVTDRPTKAHEYLFLLAKREQYYFDAQSIAEPSEYPGDNRALRKDTRKIIDSMCADGGSRARTGNPTSDTRNRRSVWSIPTQPFCGAHFATFPRALIEPCILAGSRAGNVVIDPFIGSGTTAQVATDLGRQFIGCELNPEYVELHELRRTTIGMPI